MTAHGVRWQRPLAGTLHLGRTNRFFLGGGKALVNTYHRTAAALGVEVRYGACVTDLAVDGPGSTEVVLDGGERIGARAVVCASGGFEANLDWLRRYWGEAADGFLVRGCRENDGRVLAALLARGAATAGQERGFHCVAIDARAPRFDGGIATRLDSIPFSVVVNADGRRFYDEGEDLWPKRYAIWGRNVAGQPGQIAYSLWDAKVNERFLPPMFRPATAPGLPALAGLLGLDPAAVAATVKEYNAAVRPGAFDPSRLDDCATEGLDPPKSHWALPLDTPPYYGIALRPGITFTYLGVRVDESARVLDAGGRPLGRVFAAGEIMSGNILSSGYLAGFGVTIGHVWGRIAGEAAASGPGNCRPAPCSPRTCSLKRSASSPCATPAATARATARSFPRSNCVACSPRATSLTWPTCATTAGPAIRPACTRRRTSSRSTRPRSCPRSGGTPTTGTCLACRPAALRRSRPPVLAHW
jgi:tricarballylate dehydrogenase